MNGPQAIRPADRILGVLYDGRDRHVSLDELAGAAGAGAAAVAAALGGLRGRGHRLEAMPGRGVRLLCPTVLDAHLIERGLPVAEIGRHVICFGQVDSTNDVAFASAERAAGRAVVVTAEHQRAGRGRLGRTWRCPAGSGVLASVLLHEAAAALPAEALTVAAGLAVAEGIERAAAVETTLAWPNDVLIGPAKVAGVLVEVRSSGPPAGGGGRVVVGIGINVNAVPPPGEVSGAATSLARAAGRDVERIEVCRGVLASLDGWVRALAEGAVELLHRRWLSRCEMVNRRFRFVAGGRDVAGRILDVHPMEGLILLCDDGQRLHLPAATTTVLKPTETPP